MSKPKTAPIVFIEMAETVDIKGKTYWVNPITRELRPCYPIGASQLSPDVEAMLRPQSKQSLKQLDR